MIQVFIALIILTLMWSTWDQRRKKLTCGYCGGFKKHEPSCPLSKLN